MRVCHSDCVVCKTVFVKYTCVEVNSFVSDSEFWPRLFIMKTQLKSRLIFSYGVEDEEWEMQLRILRLLAAAWLILLYHNIGAV